MLGHDMKNGLLPNDFELVGQLVANICYHNASRYFGFCKNDPTSLVAHLTNLTTNAGESNPNF